ncbi:MAG: 23S rRNA (guanosine(2251)-2'-O)-methyltransferase RlmB [Lachnospiraceae bacterium]
MISSTSNAQIKRLLQLQKKGKVRKAEGVFIVEGIRMFAEVPKDQVEKLYISENLLKKYPALSLESYPVEVLSEQVFAAVSDTKTPQGILCVVQQREYQLQELLNEKNPYLMVLDNIQDPGNLGTIMRTAEGAGATGIIMSQDCVDVYNPKTIRSTMGSIYRVPFVYVEQISKMFPLLKKKGIKTYAAHLDGKHTYDKEDYTKGTAFIIGNEGNGLRADITEQADVKVRIPMHGEVESLNAAIAASILMFEVCRQRR